MVERPMRFLAPAITPRVWVGANYWSRTGGPLMWRSFDERVVREELEVLTRHGLNVVRSFCYWPDFMPAPDTLAPEYLERYRRFVDLCEAAGIATIPTFIVGHMSGENWDVPWRGGRDLYADGWMLAQQAFFVREVAARLYDSPAVVAWLISNEMPLYGGSTRAEYARSWGQLMVQAVRAAGARQPVSLGDGAWGPEVTGRDNGFRLRELAGFVDFIGPHVYPVTDDVVRHHLKAAFSCELSHVGLPVILEEFGVTSDFVSDAHAADYYRQALHTTLLAGATGWLAWNNTDFDLPDQDPYRHHPFEQHFGLTTVEGTPKAQLGELRRFHELLRAVQIERCRRPPAEAALLVPSYFETEYPFTEADERAQIRPILLQSYAVAREADLAVALTRERDGAPDVRLILLPSTKWLTAPTWKLLEKRVRGGATLYLSYFAGATPGQRGPWHANLNALFGVEHQLRHGLVDPVEEEVVTWTMREPLGDLTPGQRLHFRAAGNEHGRSYLPLLAREARTLAIDQRGRPALVERALGDGRLILATYPVEYFAAARPHANPEDTHRLYHALALRAGVSQRVGAPQPQVLVDTLERDDGAQFAWFISESDQELDVEPRLPPRASLRPLHGNAAFTGPVRLAPFGVEVFELVREDA